MVPRLVRHIGRKEQLPQRGAYTSLKTRLVFYSSIVAALIACVLYATSMPGTSYSGPLPAATPALLGLDARLREHVTALASGIGIRNVHPTRPLDRRTRVHRSAWRGLLADWKRDSGARENEASHGAL
jgi:hypothetical protein